MTRRKQLWGQQRGWIVPSDGSPPQELPQQMVGYKLISWLGTMPETQPAKLEQVRIIHGRAEGHGDALEGAREVAADGEHRPHPIDRDRDDPRPSRKNQQPRSRSSRADGAVP